MSTYLSWGYTIQLITCSYKDFYQSYRVKRIFLIWNHIIYDCIWHFTLTGILNVLNHCIIHLFWIIIYPDNISLESKCRTLQNITHWSGLSVWRHRDVIPEKHTWIPWIQYFTKFVENSQRADSCFWIFGNPDTMPQYILMYVLKKKMREKSSQNCWRFGVGRNSMYWLRCWVASISTFCQRFCLFQCHVIFHSCTLLKHVTPLNTLFSEVRKQKF